MNELLHAPEAARPHSVIQPNTGVIGRVAISGAPFASLRGCKLGGRKILQCFHAGVVVQIIGGVTTDTYLLKFFTGCDKAGVIVGQRNIILLKKVAVDNKTVDIGAYRQPVYAVVLIFEAVKIGIVDGTCYVGCSKVHQTVL